LVDESIKQFIAKRQSGKPIDISLLYVSIAENVRETRSLNDAVIVGIMTGLPPFAMVLSVEELVQAVIAGGFGLRINAGVELRGGVGLWSPSDVVNIIAARVGLTTHHEFDFAEGERWKKRHFDLPVNHHLPGGKGKSQEESHLRFCFEIGCSFVVLQIAEFILFYFLDKSDSE
jgi:hypothetical protein